MLHPYSTFKKAEAIVERVHGAMFNLKCPICGKIDSVAMEPGYLPDIMWCWGQPTHEDWKRYKKSRGLKNEDIAKIVGLTADSVKTMTQRNKPLPTWALSMLCENQYKSTRTIEP